jgi:serine/threonine protein phosphatase 1
MSCVRWIVGDIHGMFLPLDALLSAVGRRDPAARFIFVGDYINRGPDSRKVIDRLVTLKDATFLRGNHDDIFDLVLHGDCYMCHANAPDPVSAFAWFMQHGLAETLMSYGADGAELESVARRPNARRIKQFIEIVPASHRKFIRDLRPVFETDNFFVTHGYWDPDSEDDDPNLAAPLARDPQLRYKLLWGRFTDAQIRRKKRWSRTGYFGHTPVLNYASAKGLYEPIRGAGIVLLDTAVALSVSGMLSAVCAESGAVLQSDRGGNILELP